YYGQISQSTDSNDFSYITDQERKKISGAFVHNTPNFRLQEDISVFIGEFVTNNNISMEGADFSHYMDILGKKTYDNLSRDLTTSEANHKRIIERNLARFTSFISSSNLGSRTLDLTIYVSSGISGGYANVRNKTVYVPSFEFDSLGNPTAGSHSDFFTITGVHEIGHIVGTLDDEYYAYGLDALPSSKSDLIPLASEEIKFKNNCFTGYVLEDARTTSVTLDRIFIDGDSPQFYRADQFSFDFRLTDINNPWHHASKVPFYQETNINSTITILTNTSIPNYNGRLYGGCHGGKSFRGTQNSIMNQYGLIKPSQWPTGWGPINSFYIKKGLEGYN
ncbi:MAG: hypothetical protein OXB84_05135, partial [Halobacteriovoraceae bacterium]|nr:hypothetical protein [Halobacteriovoraceae bacterium]